MKSPISYCPAAAWLQEHKSSTRSEVSSGFSSFLDVIFLQDPSKFHSWLVLFSEKDHQSLWFPAAPGTSSSSFWACRNEQGYLKTQGTQGRTSTGIVWDGWIPRTPLIAALHKHTLQLLPTASAPAWGSTAKSQVARVEVSVLKSHLSFWALVKNSYFQLTDCIFYLLCCISSSSPLQPLFSHSSFMQTF